jgi:hypothetical protein
MAALDFLPVDRENRTSTACYVDGVDCLSLSRQPLDVGYRNPRRLSPNHGPSGS